MSEMISTFPSSQRRANATTNSHNAFPYFDAPALFREQRELLESASASEIHASVFLRLRLSAQQKLTAQRNQLAERRSKRTSVLAPPSAALSIRSGEAEEDNTGAPTVPTTRIASAQTTAEVHHCPGCGRRYTDASLFARHQSCCREYAALLRRSSAECAVPQSARFARGTAMGASGSNSASLNPSAGWNAELRATYQRLDSMGHASPRAEAQTARGVCHPVPAFPDPTQPFPPRAFAPPTESPTNRSPSPPCSSLAEERPAHAAPSMVSSANPLDDVPASAAARRLPSDSGSVSAALWSTPLPTPAHSEAQRSGGPNEAEADEPLRPCPHCGRHFFAESRWPRHVAVCEQQQQMARPAAKTNGATRRVFDTRARRTSQIYADETSLSGSAMMRKAAAMDRPLASGRRSVANSEVNGDGKRSKWRQQRAQLRQALQLSGDGGNGNGGSSTMENEEAFVDDRVQCPACGRKFAQAAAERHIPLCKERHGGLRSMRL